MKRALLVGNYGVGNVGDEALKEYFLTRIPVEWIIVSALPDREEVPRLPCGFRSIVTPWWRTLWAYWSCDAVVFGGGTLFTDIESVLACVLWWEHAFVAWILRKPIILAFQGIGPFRTRIGQWCARWVVQRAAFISVRDQGSADRIRAWRKSVEAIQTFDPIILLVPESHSASSMRKMIVIPRHNSGHRLIERFTFHCAREPWQAIGILSFQSDQPDEQVVCQKLKGLVVGAAIVPVRSLPDVLRELSDASLVVTERYHGALIALALGIPLDIVSQGEGDKLESLIALLDDTNPVKELKRSAMEGEKVLVDFMRKM